MTKDSTEQLQKKIEANLNTDDINPTFKLKNGNVAKASKWFCETRNQWMFSIGYYEEGLGLYLTAEFAIFENLIARMKDLADGDLSLWEIADSTSAMTKQQFAMQTLRNTMIALGTEEEVLEGMDWTDMSSVVLSVAHAQYSDSYEEMTATPRPVTRIHPATTAYMIVFSPLITDGRNSITEEGMESVFALVNCADSLEATNKELIAALERAYSNAFYENATETNLLMDWRGAAESAKRLLLKVGVSEERLSELEKAVMYEGLDEY